jgi:arylsulfatase A-like enzyme
MTRNGNEPVKYDGNYSTDVIASKAEGFIDEAVKQDRPWMLTVAPNAPHSNGSHDATRNANWFGEPEFAPRHADLFKDLKAPRDESFNTLIEDAVSWVNNVPELNQTVIDYIDEFQRCRLRALQAVDDMIGNLVEKLDKLGELDNTYIFFSTDNGYHLGQHRMQPGKNCGYGESVFVFFGFLIGLTRCIETDINVPLIVRGPGIGKNQTLDAITSHTDLAPTFLSLAGATREGLDGKKIPTTVAASTADNRTEHVAIEYWGLVSQVLREGLYNPLTVNSGCPRRHLWICQ